MSTKWFTFETRYNFSSKMYIGGTGMAKLSIVKMYKEGYKCVGSCLRTPSMEVFTEEFGCEWLNQLIFDMFETLYANASGVGLAANQVGILKKVCVIDLKKDGKKPLVLINPSYVPIDESLEDSEEVCLSFPLVSSTVRRYKKIKVVYQDLSGNRHEIDADGFKSKVFQHEIDHLNGIVHIDLNSNPKGVSDYSGYSYKIAKNALNNLLDVGIKENER